MTCEHVVEIGDEVIASLTATEIGMRGIDTSVDDIGASASSAGVVVGVSSGAASLVGDAGKTPGSRGLCDIGALLDLLSEISLDDGILLDIVDLAKLVTQSSSRSSENARMGAWRGSRQYRRPYRRQIPCTCRSRRRAWGRRSSTSEPPGQDLQERRSSS